MKKSMFITVPEASKALGVTRARIGKLCADKRIIGAHKAGSIWLIPRAIVIKPSKGGHKLKKINQVS